MGCKFSNPDKSDEYEDNNQITTLSRKENVQNESEVVFKASELIGEKKGNISNYYLFEKTLGEGKFNINW